MNRRGVTARGGLLGRDRARTLALLVALALSLVAAACDIAASGQPGASGLPSSSSGVAPSVSFEVPSFVVPVPRSPVAGVVTSINSQGLDKVKGFTLRTRSGVDLTFVIGQLDNGADFPPGHLAEHQASLEPILVWFKTEGDKLVVYHLEDAG
jgi:hypothetical protein